MKRRRHTTAVESWRAPPRETPRESPREITPRLRRARTFSPLPIIIFVVIGGILWWPSTATAPPQHPLPKFIRELANDRPLPTRPFPSDPAGGGAWTLSLSSGDQQVADFDVFFGAPQRGRWDACPATTEHDLVPVRLTVRNRQVSAPLAGFVSMVSTPVLPFDSVRFEACNAGAFSANMWTTETQRGSIPPEGVAVIDGFLLVHDTRTMQALESGTWTLAVYFTSSARTTSTLTQTATGTGPRLQLLPFR